MTTKLNITMMNIFSINSEPLQVRKLSPCNINIFLPLEFFSPRLIALYIPLD